MVLPGEVSSAPEIFTFVAKIAEFRQFLAERAPAMKKVSFVRSNNQRHWVGDGFPVRSVFSYNDIARELSPFLLLDYAGPAEFAPTERKLGVGEHPHRGFETVTIVYSGEVEH